MPSPQLAGAVRSMSIRSLVFVALLGAVGVMTVATLMPPDAPVATLEQTLGADVRTSRL